MKKLLSLLSLITLFNLYGCAYYEQTGEEWHDMTPQERNHRIDETRQKREGKGTY
ncbi:MAG: hypothetical protein ACK5LE_06815 [Alphaproteobacteria bacterium]